MAAFEHVKPQRKVEPKTANCKTPGEVVSLLKTKNPCSRVQAIHICSGLSMHEDNAVSNKFIS